MASTLPADSLPLWPSTHASIPANHTRQTAFDEKMLQGDDSGYSGPTNGGSSSLHVHEVTSHTHTETSTGHQHYFSAASTSMASDSETTSPKPTSRYTIRWSHYHVSKRSSAKNIVTGSSTAFDSTSAVTDDYPPHLECIVLQPDDGSQNIANGVLGFYNGTSAPTNFTIADGTGGTVDCVDKYIKGADTGSGNGGSSSGSASHTHNSASHTHTADHTHYGISCGSANTTSGYSPLSYPPPQTMAYAHHVVSMGLTSGQVTSGASPSSDSEDNDPKSKYMLAIQNVSGSAQAPPTGYVIAYDGSIGAIPSGWQLSDGTNGTEDLQDYQIKGTDTGGEVGDVVNSSNSHTHTFAHTHTFSSHNHSAGVSGNYYGVNTRSGMTFTDAAASHTHTWTVNNSTPAISDSDSTASESVDIRREYRTIVWIQKVDVVVSRRVMVIS